MGPFDQCVTVLHCDDLERPARFHEEILGVPPAPDQGACRIYRVSPDGFVGLCRCREGRPVSPEGVIVTPVTGDVDGRRSAPFGPAVAASRAVAGPAGEPSAGRAARRAGGAGQMSLLVAGVTGEGGHPATGAGQGQRLVEVGIPDHVHSDLATPPLEDEFADRGLVAGKQRRDERIAHVDGMALGQLAQLGIALAHDGRHLGVQGLLAGVRPASPAAGGLGHEGIVVGHQAIVVRLQPAAASADIVADPPRRSRPE